MAVSRRAAELWDSDEAQQMISWWSSPRCRAYYNEAVCGEPGLPTISEGPRHRLRSLLNGRVLGRGVSVGCGQGDKELAVLKDGLAEGFDLWEIAPGLVAEGRAAAEAAGLGERAAFRQGDAFAAPVTGQYDLVYWDHSLHHMSDVSKALAWSVDALRPGGVVLVNDYVGPNRLQNTRAEIDACNAYLAKIGHSFRAQYSNLFTKLRQWKRDPSEAPQSERIGAAVESQLPGSRLEPIGGTILNILGGVIVPDFDDDSPQMDALLEADATLRDAGSSHFAFAIWQKP